MRKSVFVAALVAVLISSSALAQIVIEMAPGEVRIFDSPTTFDRLIMPPTDYAEVNPLDERRMSIIAYKPGRFNVIAMNGNSIANSFWVHVQEPAIYERRAVTVYRDGRASEVHSCSRETGACVLYKDMRTPPPPIISTGPIITGEAARLQNQSAQPARPQPTQE